MIHLDVESHLVKVPTVARRTVRLQYVQSCFEGSLRQMMTALVAEAPWTDDELDALNAEINRVWGEKREKS